MVRDIIIKTPIFNRKVQVGLVAADHQMAVYSGTPITTPIYDERALDFLKEYIAERIETDWDFPILVDGERGGGKSSLVIKLAQKIDPKLDLDSIIFEAKQFADRFQHNKPGSQIIIDEAIWGMYAGEWMDVVQAYLVKILDIGRAKRQVIYFLVPDRRHLNKKIREDVPRLFLHVVTRKGRRGFCEVFQATRENAFYGNWWMPYFAFKFSPIEGEFWDKYQERKIAFLNDALDYKKQTIKEDRMNQIVHNLYHSKCPDCNRKLFSLTDIGAMVDLDASNVMRRLNKIDAIS